MDMYYGDTSITNRHTHHAFNLENMNLQLEKLDLIWDLLLVLSMRPMGLKNPFKLDIIVFFAVEYMYKYT